MDKEDLIKFEEEIAELFNGANISAPVHLYYGNEDQIIDVFKKVGPNKITVTRSAQVKGEWVLQSEVITLD